MRVAEETAGLAFTPLPPRVACIRRGTARLSARANRNHRLRIRWRAEIIVVFSQTRALPSSSTRSAREAGTTRAGAAFNIVAHDADGYVYFAFDFRLRGGDDVEPERAASAGATGRLIALRRRAAPEETHHISNGRD